MCSLGVNPSTGDTQDPDINFTTRSFGRHQSLRLFGPSFSEWGFKGSRVRTYFRCSGGFSAGGTAPDPLGVPFMFIGVLHWRPGE